ncbi:MAG: DUF4274 domain-containing protein [Planctomycetaceae bacterium]|nr:DUF4274 domain-containing protein [Planctomycetaceae bacterium]
MNETQRNRITDLLNAQITVNSFRRRIKVIRDPVELHQIAVLACKTGLWHDAGFQWPQSIANHPHCDAGTGLMLYWMESPENVYKFGTCVDSDESGIAHLEYIRSIEFNYLHGTYRTSKIRFAPPVSPSRRRNLDQYRWIPSGMLIPSPGGKVKTLNWKWDRNCQVILK